jgi:hypothetical protein
VDIVVKPPHAGTGVEVINYPTSFLFHLPIVSHYTNVSQLSLEIPKNTKHFIHYYLPGYSYLTVNRKLVPDENDAKCLLLLLLEHMSGIPFNQLQKFYILLLTY